jgi:hypothetical protein
VATESGPEVSISAGAWLRVMLTAVHYRAVGLCIMHRRFKMFKEDAAIGIDEWLHPFTATLL